MRMKSLSRLLAVLLIAAMLPLSALAQNEIKYQAYAEALAPLGVFVGSQAGFELGERPTRVQGIVILIRLLGAEAEALAMANDSIPFTDVHDWARGYVAYALKHGLTQGMSPTTFGYSVTLEPKMFCTFLLRSLGFSDANGDFEYDRAVEFAFSMGLVRQEQMDEISDGLFLRDQVAKLSYDALFYPCKGGSLSLLDRLVSDGKIDPGKAEIFTRTSVVSETLPDKSIEEIGRLAAGVVMLEGKYSSGSGVIISEDGLIATCYHVIKGEPFISVTFDDGSVYSGEVFVRDYSEALDLALIKIAKTGLSPVEIGGSDVIMRGDTVYAIGSPLGYVNTLSEGVVAEFADVYGINAIQFTAPVNWGSSGGALFDAKGRLIGITFANDFGGQNTGFAVPSGKIASLTRTLDLTPAGLIESIVTPYAPAKSAPSFAESADVPDFGAMYGISPSEYVSQGGFCVYVYDGVTEEHINAYEDYLESLGYVYSQYATQVAGGNGVFNNPAAFVNESAGRVVVTDVFFYGDITALAVMFEAG